MGQEPISSGSPLLSRISATSSVAVKVTTGVQGSVLRYKLLEIKLILTALYIIFFECNHEGSFFRVTPHNWMSNL